MAEETEIARRLKEARAKRNPQDTNKLSHWVREHFDELERERRVHKFSFTDIANAAADLGIKADRGKRKPSGAMARKYYQDVEAEKKRSEKTK